MGKIILFVLVVSTIVYFIGEFIVSSNREYKLEVLKRVGIVAICTTIAAIIGFVLVVLF